VLLAVFLLNLAAGLVLFLPLVGRRSAGVKFYRLVLIIGAVLCLCALVGHFSYWALAPVAATVLLWFVLRYPKRLIFRFAAILTGASYLAASIVAYDAAVQPPNLAISIAGALTSIALLGSVNLAMTLGHWYLVVRGMPIEPLKRLTIATLISTIAKIILVVVTIIGAGLFHEVGVRHGMFFWMRVGWGLVGPLVLYPMVWGTVKIRSTMAATGILYVDVVAVVIGEVLGGWLSALVRMPV
jgi:hypothetical protein